MRWPLPPRPLKRFRRRTQIIRSAPRNPGTKNQEPGSTYQAQGAALPTPLKPMLAPVGAQALGIGAEGCLRGELQEASGKASEEVGLGT